MGNDLSEVGGKLSHLELGGEALYPPTWGILQVTFPHEATSYMPLNPSRAVTPPCPMPHAPCPMPHAPCPMPHTQEKYLFNY